jgi:hypothetical protein
MEHCMKNRILLSALAAWTTLATTGYAETANPSSPVRDTPVVYVSDFDVDASAGEPASHGLLANLGHGGLLGRQADPVAQAHEAVELLADTLTKDLKQAGIDARRAPPGAELPKSGWRVRGVLLSVDDGSVARRAIIGFGAGRSSLQVAMTVDDLAKPQQPLMQGLAGASGGRMPGAIVMLNPYAVAAKVVLAGRDRDKAIKHAAQQIADAVVQRVQGKTAPQGI